MREIRTLRAMWRELETELRTLLNGHEGGNLGYGQASVLTGHRASSRPYRVLPLTGRRRNKQRKKTRLEIRLWSINEERQF